MSFPNSSGSDLDKIFPQVFEDLISESNGNAGLNFLKTFTKPLNHIGEGKVSNQIVPFMGAKRIGLIKIDGNLLPIAIGNRLS